MKTLLVLRHAKSSWADSGQDDHERPLNDRGEREAPQVGEQLRQRKLVPDLIISSDAVRARTTAVAVARASGHSGEIRLDHSLYLAAPDDILSVLRNADENAGIVMVVGHNPGLEGLVVQLTGEPAHLATATVAEIALPIDAWRELDESTLGRLSAVWRPEK
jgi:phosphohistidine phosphatase